jgi:2-amino-4-hydroxy-6-hydroxymethyldihydropteridine diphosphokinase
MIVLGLGSNSYGKWGSPSQTLHRAFEALDSTRIRVLAASNLYDTQPLDIKSKNTFVNAAALIETALPPLALLKVIKQFEVEAGRKKSRLPTSRCLDIDIIAYHDITIALPPFSPRGRAALIIPHPEAHKRPFVLKPISDIAPFWHHPVFRLTAAQMLLRLPRSAGGAVLRLTGISA